jgi:hypothetical protein
MLKTFISRTLANRTLQMRPFHSAVSAVALRRTIEEADSILLDEISNTPETDRDFAALDHKFSEFNKLCEEQLREMNNNLIANIVEDNGIEEWTTVSNILIKRKLGQ